MLIDIYLFLSFLGKHGRCGSTSHEKSRFVPNAVEKQHSISGFNPWARTAAATGITAAKMRKLSTTTSTATAERAQRRRHERRVYSQEDKFDDTEDQDNADIFRAERSSLVRFV
jgi:hypothetical protein